MFHNHVYFTRDVIRIKDLHIRYRNSLTVALLVFKITITSISPSQFLPLEYKQDLEEGIGKE